MQNGDALSTIGKALFVVGIMIATAGAALHLIGKWGIQWPHLPGDFTLRIGNTTVYLPIATSIALSIVVSLIFYAVGMLRR